MSPPYSCTLEAYVTTLRLHVEGSALRDTALAENTYLRRRRAVARTGTTPSSVVPRPVPMSTSSLQTAWIPSVLLVGCRHGGTTTVDCKVSGTRPMATLANGTSTSPGHGAAAAHWGRRHWSKVPSSNAGVPGGVGARRAAAARAPPKKKARSQTPRPLWHRSRRRERRRYRRPQDPPPCQRRPYRRCVLPAQSVVVEPRRRVAPRQRRAPL